ncbi:cyclic AMP-dependent transcription factor ATF-4 [Anguilla anguilla]|uniref:cyclic AMP-dependent transcription factor ATF-4 n=1 Tax=Anguilla anguilla TaxID=7936 RepID=UPI0015B0C73D|nr:cyclic AMP-dependent transcription factor ATF-4 [Anguilla anguilla]
MSLSSLPAMGDVGALLLGPSFLTADPPGPLLDEDEEYLVGTTSPLSFSSADSPTSLLSLSPPPSPPPALGCKLGDELLPLPWLCDSAVLDVSINPADGKEDGFSGMDWMAEDIDLSEFDLDSLMGSYESDEPPSSPEELIASLESHMDLDLDLDPLQFTAPATSIAPPLEELAVPQPDLPPPSPMHSPEPQQEVAIKSEPASPAPSPSPLPALLPTFALELGSEVDVAENEGVAPGIVLSLSASHIVVLLAPKEEAAVVSPDDQSDTDSGIGSDSPRHSSCSTPPPSGTAPPPTPRAASRSKPYSIVSKSEPAAKPGKVKSASGAPVVVEKKLKKMEQNKTAATRYRQKKRVEQESLSDECSRLEQRNRELTEKADSISKEIQYLKDLIEEVRNAKNKRKSRPEQL